MSALFEQSDDHATALTPEEMRDLVPTHISYRSELNEAEQENIARAQDWALSRRRDLLSEKFIKNLHRQMLGDVWRWAGKFRTSERNLGIDYWLVPMALRKLLDDAKTWIACNAYPLDEIGVRYHHRLVQIHLFPNGNGRHSRLIADLLMIQMGRERFSWGQQRLRDAGAARKQYIEPLRAADNHDIVRLVSFARA